MTADPRTRLSYRHPIRRGKGALWPGGPRWLRAAPRLTAICLVDRDRLADPLALVRHLPTGTWVILRDYDRPDRRAMAQRLARLCRARRLPFLVAGDAKLATRVGADGVHCPERALTGPRSGRWRRRGVVTAAAHSPQAIRQAHRAGADLLLLSPVFPTASHPGRSTLGPHRLARLMPLAGGRGVALGGIGPRTVRRLPPGLAGIAAIEGWEIYARGQNRNCPLK